MDQTVNYRNGHRGRVRERFLKEGLSVFADYEILELLLFFAVPRRDTKGMAHALMHTFSSLYAVLTASEKELCAVDGIGKHTAEFLRSLLPFAEYVLKREERPPGFLKDDMLGPCFVSYFNANADASVGALLLNNRREPLRFLMLSDHGVGIERCAENLAPLVETAYSVNAPYVVLAYHKKEGIPYPSVIVMDAIAEVQNALNAVGLKLLEVVCVAGEQYNLLLGMMNGVLRYPTEERRKPSDVHVLPMCAVNAYVTAATRQAGQRNDAVDEIAASADSFEKFCELLRHFMAEESAKSEAKNLLSRYLTLEILLSVPYHTLTEKDGAAQNTALILGVIGEVYARARLERLIGLNRPIEDAETLGRLFSDLLGARREEVLALAILDEKKKITHVHFCAPGTVNATPVLYRSLVQAAVQHKAKYVAAAHNHPLGEIQPSTEDLATTGEMVRLFRGVNITFLEHFVVNDRDYLPIVKEYLSET